MKLSNVRSKTFSAATADALDAAVKAWTATAGEKEYLDAQFEFDGATFTLVLIYSE